jgi:hypothetical protein
LDGGRKTSVTANGHRTELKVKSRDSRAPSYSQFFIYSALFFEKKSVYRPTDLSVKLVLTLADRELPRSQRDGSATAVISVFYTGAATFSSK